MINRMEQNCKTARLRKRKETKDKTNKPPKEKRKKKRDKIVIRNRRSAKRLNPDTLRIR